MNVLSVHSTDRVQTCSFKTSRTLELSMELHVCGKYRPYQGQGVMGVPSASLRGFSAKLLEREALHKQGSLFECDKDQLMSAQAVEEIYGHCHLVSVPFHLPSLLTLVSVLLGRLFCDGKKKISPTTLGLYALLSNSNRNHYYKEIASY